MTMRLVVGVTCLPGLLLSSFFATIGVPVLLAPPAVVAQERTVSAADYLPVNSNVFCRRTYTDTFGSARSFTNQIVGSVTAPYTTGPLTGALFCGFADDQSLSGWYNDGRVLRNILDGDHYASTDCSMSAFPPGGMPASIHDGQVLSFSDLGGVAVKKDLVGCEVSGDSDESLLFRIQDVTVGKKDFRTTVVAWFLQNDEAFVPLTFFGKDVELGLSLPDAEATGGRRAFGFFVLARNEGMIAGGSVGETGELTSLYELTSVDCSAAPRWDVFDVPGYYHARARAINDGGDIVGYTEKRAGTARAFLRRDGVMTLFHPSELNADGSWATGINNRGDIVGYFNVGDSYHGYLLRNGGYTQIDAPDAPATLAFGINDRGDVVGTVYVGFNLPYYGFLLRDGTFTEIRVPGATWTQALGVNNDGDIVGNFGDASGIHGFMRSADAYAVIDYPGAVETHVSGINDDDDVAGDFRATTGGPLTAFGRLKGEFLAIRGPCSVSSSNAIGINRKGTIVGHFLDGSGRMRWAFVVSDIKKGQQ